MCLFVGLKKRPTAPHRDHCNDPVRENPKRHKSTVRSKMYLIERSKIEKSELENDATRRLVNQIKCFDFVAQQTAPLEIVQTLQSIPYVRIRD